jgi:hypothetical protein
VADLLEHLERRIDGLRAAVRRAAIAGDRGEARQLRSDLRQAERAWDEALAVFTADAESGTEPEGSQHVPEGGSVLPIRELVHQALTFLGVPTAPKLIVAVHEAFFAGELIPARLTSLRRDEERSFRSSPHARPYYLCSALTADRLAPARGLLAVSTWPLERRMIGPLSPRVDFLTATIRLARRLSNSTGPSSLPARRLLWRFATNVPGAVDRFEDMEPATVAESAQTELAVHQDVDHASRASAAKRAVGQLDEVQQLFGAPLGVVRTAATE